MLGMVRVNVRVASRGSAASVQTFGKMGANLPREIGFNRARVSLLVGDAELAQRLYDGARWHLEFAREFIYTDRAHSIAGLSLPALTVLSPSLASPVPVLNSANRFCFSVFYGSRFTFRRFNRFGR